MHNRQYYIYILMNAWNTTSYIGVTGNLPERIQQHKQKVVDGFTKKYNIDKLVYYECFTDIREAIAREKQLKNWARQKKINLIQTVNKNLQDLSEEL